MGGNNNFIKTINAAKLAGCEVGIQMGRQQILDMVSLVLRDPDIMGKDTFGKERLLKVIKGVGEYIDKYELA